MTPRFLIAVAVLVITLFGSVAVAVAAPGHLSGLLEWRYGAHTASENGTQVLDAGHFTQKYSLLWDKEGTFMRGRLGKYNVSLGYEWSWVDARRGDDVQVLIDNPLDKILYRGDISIAPGGLPFNLRLYSYDLHSTSFDYNDYSELFNLPNKGEQGGTIGSVRNGTYKVSGLTMAIGEENGRYEGKYRDLLTTVPRLLIDYRQVDVKDTKGPFKRDYLDRDLAFISLNKQNNWLHYRVFIHEDNLDSKQDYREETYLLGTINHRNQREWVNLTNWIQISSDISYSEHITSPGDIVDLQKRYDLNLFARAARTRWEGSSYSNFSRVSVKDSLNTDLHIPLFAKGELNKDTSWRFRFVGERTQKNYFTGNLDDTEDLFVSGKVDTFRQSRYIFSPLVEAERKDGTTGRGFAGHAGAEFYSNPSYRSPYDFFGQVDIRYFNGVADGGSDVDYSEITAVARVQKDINSALRAGFDQRVVFGSGLYDSTVTDNISSVTNAQVNNQRDNTFRSTTGLFVEHRSQSKLRNRLGANMEYLSAGAFDGAQYRLEHSIEYAGRVLKASAATAYMTGDSLPALSGETQVSAENQWDHVSRITYSPSRALKGNLQLNYSYFDYGNGSTEERYNVLQLAEYSIWNNSGVIRKQLVLGEEFEIEKNAANGTNVESDFVAFTLFADYFPTKATLLGARLRYDIDERNGSDTISCYLTAGVDFRQFKVSLDYSYGDRTKGDTIVQRNEERWELTVAKSF